MFTLILIALIIAGFLMFKFFCDSDTFATVEHLKESRIVKKFNHLLKQLKSSNIDVIKEKLLSTLEQYRDIKCAQFAENRTQLQEANKAVNEQINAINDTISQKSNRIRANKSIYSEEEGAHMMYDLELYKNVLDKLRTSSVNLKNKCLQLDGKIAQFNSTLALRKAKIITMIADAISINDRSHIDLRLDSLEKEFEHEATLKENEQYVSEKVKEQSSDALEFDLEKYKKLYQEFK